MQEEPFSARPLASLAKMLKRIYLISDVQDQGFTFHMLTEVVIIHGLRKVVAHRSLILSLALSRYPSLSNMRISRCVYSYLTISSLQTVSQS